MRSVYIDDLRGLNPESSKVYDLSERSKISRCVSKYLHKEKDPASPEYRRYQLSQNKIIQTITVKRII